MQKPIPRGDTFQVKWRSGRKGEWQSCTFGDEDTAIRACQVVDGAKRKISDKDVYAIVLDLPVEEEPESPYFEAFALEWVKKKKGVQENTRARYESQLITRAIPKLGKFRLHELEYHEQVADWVHWLEDELGLAPASVRRYHTVVYQCLRTALGRYIARHPLDPPQGEEENLPKLVKFDACFLTVDEAYLIIKNCSEYIRDMVEIAFHTGMRLGELIALRRKDVNLSGKRKVIYVRQALKDGNVVGEPKSKASRRTITLDKVAIDILTRLVLGKNPDDLMFPAPKGGMWSKDNFRERFWKPAVLAAQRCAKHPPEQLTDKRGRKRDNLKVPSTCACEGRLHQTPRFHDARHTHVAWLIDLGWNAYAIQRRIGHDSIKTTFDIYGHLLPDADEGGLDELDKLTAKARAQGDLALAA